MVERVEESHTPAREREMRTARTGVLDVVVLYKRYCYEEGCRVNSALVQLFERRGRGIPLETISLQNNYLGARGLRPIVRLIDHCQTTTGVYLDGNGVTNEVVQELCRVLETHLSVTAVSLSDNPVTEEGGQRLLALVETNHRITYLNLRGTDVFEALRDRIELVVEANRLRREHQEPKLESAAAESAPATSSRSSASLPPMRAKKESPTLEVLPRRTSPHAATETPSPAASRGGPSAHITKPRPRPPLPALAAQHAKRIPLGLLNSMRAKFAARATLRAEIHARSSSEMAHRARMELMTFTSRPGQTRSRPTAVPAASSELHADAAEAPPGDDGEAGERSQRRSITSPVGLGAGGEGLAFPSMSVRRTSAGDEPVPASEEETAAADGEAEAEAEATTTTEDEGGDSPGPARRLLVSGSDSKEARLSQSLTSEESFQRLFDRGCQYYAHRDLDAAYLSWNEALNLASAKNQREWMVVVSGNLQRLSYQLLVKEGTAQLEDGQLEEADKSFELALELAVRARNAAWEADMQKARRGLQTAVFHRCHKAAAVLFDRARHTPEQRPTEDDYYVVPGTDSLVPHTAAFVSDWPRLLLIQEALGLWSEATRVARRMGSAVASVLHDLVEEALTTVACYLVARFFDAEVPTGLSWQRTTLYHASECDLLLELWRSLHAQAVESLHHRLLAAVAVGQLGNLHLATYQLAPAGQRFAELTQYGVELQSPALLATGLTFGATLQWLRAHHGTAERQLSEALRLWATVRQERRDAALQATETNEAEDELSFSREESDVRRCRRDLLRALPRDYVDVMSRACHHMAVTVLAATYRYREALEAVERGLLDTYADVLHEKLRTNFATPPSVDHIVGVSRSTGTSLVYFFLTRRYVWGVERAAYETEEILLTWVVPRGDPLRFVELNVTRDAQLSVGGLLEAVRQGMGVAPPLLEGPATDILTSLPRTAWREPLQALYRIFVDPIVDFLSVLDPAPVEDPGVVTIIPVNELWAVPYNALLAASGRFLVEDMTVQLAFSAAQCAFSALSAARLAQSDLHRDVVVVQPETDPSAAARIPLTFPLNPLRSVAEGDAVVAVWAAGKHRGGASPASASPAAASDGGPPALAHTEVLVGDLEQLHQVLPFARSLHFASTVADEVENEDGSAGAMCVPTSHDHIGLLRASEIAHRPLFAELVTMSHANLSVERARGARCGVLGLLRSFFGSGVPCVVVSQWCTPDMTPADVLTRFYDQLARARRAPTRPVTRVDGGGEGRGVRSTRRDAGSSSPRGPAPPRWSKALCLATAIRELLAEKEDLRYTPHVWAGYYCVGGGFLA